MNAYSRQALSWLMLCLILAGLTAYGLALRDQVRALDERIESHYALVSSLGDTLYRLRANLGYAGFINNFNHYIVRRHPRFLDAARRQLDAASQALEDYRVLAVRDDELGALDAIRQTLALHREMLELASSKASHELSAEELGARVQVDERPAGMALDELAGIARQRITRSELELAAEQRQVMRGFYWGLLGLPVIAFIGGVIWCRCRRAV